MSVNSKMTALADGVRELSGTTEAIGIDNMTSNINEANNEVESQTELLAQAAAALSGKAGGKSNTILYTEQTLTPEQQAQVRANIGAASGVGLTFLQLTTEIRNSPDENGMTTTFLSPEDSALLDAAAARKMPCIIGCTVQGGAAVLIANYIDFADPGGFCAVVMPGMEMVLSKPDDVWQCILLYAG